LIKKLEKTFYAVTVRLWWVAVLLLILTAVVISLGREMAPLLKDHKTEFEAHLSTLSGVMIEMEEVSASWEGLLPEISMKGLRIGKDAMVEKVLARIDLLSSLKVRGLVFDQLILDSATVDITLEPSGNSQEQKKQWDFSVYERLLFNSQDIRLRNIRINLFNEHGDVLQASLEKIEVENSGDDHWVNTEVVLHNKEEPVVFQTHFEGEPGEILEGSGRAYFALGDKRNAYKVLAFAGSFLDLEHFVLKEDGSVAGEVWLNWDDGVVNAVSDVQLEQLKIISDTLNLEENAEGLVLDFDGQFLVQKSKRGAYHFSITEGLIDIDPHRLKLPRSLVSYEPGKTMLSLYFPRFSVQELYPFYKLIKNKRLRNVLQTLEPGGDLVDLDIKIPLSRDRLNAFFLNANLENIAVSAWNGVPALKKVNGYVESRLYSGFVELDSEDGFSMHYPQIYDSPLEYEKGKGRIHWEIDSEEMHVYVGGQDLSLQGEEGSAKGHFWLSIPPYKSGDASEMYLSVGLQDTEVKYRNKYLPRVLPAPLLEWLESSIKAGQILDNAFIYRGSLRSGDDDERSAQYYGNVQSGQLLFDEGWSMLNELNGLVLVDDSDVLARVESADFYNLDLQNSFVEVVPSSSGEGQVINIFGNVEGQAVNAMKLLTESPIREQLGSTFDQWSLSGAIEGVANIVVPLGGATEKSKQEVMVQFSENDLDMKDVRLRFEDLSGEVLYSNIDGLQAKSLKADLWENRQKISITPVNDQDGHKDILITMEGDINRDELVAWTQFGLLDFLDGDIPSYAELTVPIDEKKQKQPLMTLNLKTDLSGVGLSLPEPLGKTKREEKLLNLEMLLWQDRQEYQVKYDDMVSALYVQPARGKGEPYGKVVINENASPSIDPSAEVEGVQIVGVLNNAELDQWLEVVNEYTKVSEKFPSAGEPLYPVFDVALNRLVMDSTEFLDVNLLIEKKEKDKEYSDHWSIGFETGFAKGALKVFDNNRLPVLYLDRVDIDQIAEEIPELDSDDEVNEKVQEEDGADEQEVVKEDPLINVNPQDLEAMEVVAKKVLYQGHDFGAWSFKVEPFSHGARFKNFNVKTDSFHITGNSQKIPAQVLWLNQSSGMATKFEGSIFINDAVAVSALFDLEPIVSSEMVELSGHLHWPGSPAMVDFKASEGGVAISARDGAFLNSSASTDVMKVINIFNFNTWARRLKLDFSDLVGKGMSFDSVQGVVQLDRGKMIFESPLVMDSPSSKFALSGVVDSVDNYIDASLAVTLPVKDNAAWIAALAGGLPVGLGVYVVGKMFSDQIENMSSLSYSITGTLDNPVIEFKHLLKSNKQAPSSSDPGSGNVNSSSSRKNRAGRKR